MELQTDNLYSYEMKVKRVHTCITGDKFFAFW